MPDPKPPRIGVRLIGFDPTLVPQQWDPDLDALAGWARVTGTWHEGTISVDGQDVARRPPPRHERPAFPEPPSGGWDPNPEPVEPPELEQLHASGAIVRHHWSRHPSGALLLRVAAGDVGQVRAALDPLLARRMWIVASRYDAETLHRIDMDFADHHRAWLFEHWSADNLTADGQPTAAAGMSRVIDDLADWADTLPPGLLHLEPTMTPA